MAHVYKEESEVLALYSISNDVRVLCSVQIALITGLWNVSSL